MNYSRKSFLTPNEILADVIKAVGDEEYRRNSKGWYISQMQQALEELSFDTLFDDKVIELPMSDDLNIEMPEFTFNISEAFVFNGDLCEIGAKRNLWHKRNYFTQGNGYLALNTDTNRDPFYSNKNFGNSVTEKDQRTFPHKSLGNENNFYYNVHNGVIMVSPACRSYQKIGLMINGTGCSVGDMPVIPLFFRQAVKDYLCEVALRNMMVDDNTKGSLWKVYDFNLNKNEQYGFYKGSWYNAKRRVADMDDRERESLKEYLAKPAW